MIELREVIYDRRARDGTWCCLPYPDHKNGCPNFPKCPVKRKDFLDMKADYIWYAVVEQFDLKAYADARSLKHPDYSDRKCRNLLYWQKVVVRRLRERAEMALYKFPESGVLLDIPEANGVHVFDTMALVGVTIDRRPDIVRKVMLIGRRR